MSGETDHHDIEETVPMCSHPPLVLRECFRCVNSPVYCVIISEITGNHELHHKSTS